MQQIFAVPKKTLVIKFANLKSTKGCIMSDNFTTLILLDRNVGFLEIPKIIFKLIHKKNKYYRRNNYGR